MTALFHRKIPKIYILILEKGQKVKRDPTWVWIATIMTLLSLVFCIYSCLVAFTALGNKIASEEFPWLDLEVMLGNE